MLSIAKRITHSIFSHQHHSRLQKLLSSKAYRKRNTYNKADNNLDSFVDIVLDADFDKKGKTISIN